MAAYARQAKARSGAALSVSGNSVSFVAAAVFPSMTGGAGGTATHAGIGLGSSGATELLFFGALTTPLAITAGAVDPTINAGSTISNTTPDGLSNSAATNLLKLLLNNTTWANFGDATGIVGSTVAGSVYVSLHTSSPGEGGNQSTNEISYT